MKFEVVLSQSAQRDIDRILHWIGQRSAVGADHWLDALERAKAGLAKNPLLYGESREGRFAGTECREQFFKTRHGRTYRMLFAIAGQEVRVLRVRGPGQPPLKGHEV